MCFIKISLCFQCAALLMCLIISGNKSTSSRAVYDTQLNVEARKGRTMTTNVEEFAARAKVCGQGLCRCHWNTANCSGHSSGLHFIPPLPASIRYLHFSFNGLQTVPTDFFQNTTQLLGVDLSNNDLTDISAEAFRPLHSLLSLYLSKNWRLRYSNLQPALTISTLKELDIMSCGMGRPPPHLFQNATLHRLKNLLMYSNGMEDISLSLFEPLSSLKFLGLAKNDMAQIQIDYVTGLNKLGLDNNALLDFPNTCEGDKSLFPNLKYLFLAGNHISRIPAQICLPELRMLSLGKNKISQLMTNSFAGYKFPKMTYLSMFTMNTQISVIENNAFNNSALKRINLSFNGIKFDEVTVKNDSFANCPELDTLQISHNSLDVSDQRFLRLFGHLTRLRFLDLQDSQMTRVSSIMFSCFPNLNHLILNRNLLSSLPDGVFDKSRQLIHLDLGKNQFHVVLPTTFSPLTRQRLKSLDLSGNPFTCSCDILWFHDWLATDPMLFKQSWSTYDCHNIPDTQIQHFFMAKQACLLSHSASLLIVLSVTLILLTLVLALTISRYRWHCRLLLFEAFRRRSDIRRERLQTHFDYDVFVSYDSKDLAWVRQYLIPQLEGRLGLRLCLHQRDFIIGRNIVDNIADSVERSKKVMMLFSNNFVRSNWCQFELTYCLRHVMDYDDVLIIVCLDGVLSRHVTAAMMAVLKVTTYIQWMEHPDAIASFWGRMQIALQEIITQPI